MNEEKKSYKLVKFIIFVVFVFICIFMYAKYVGVSGLIVKEYRLESKILSSNFSGFKVVHFSDLLYKSTIDQDDVKKVVEKINLLKADIVIFSGDLVSKGISLSEEDIISSNEEVSSEFVSSEEIVSEIESSEEVSLEISSEISSNKTGDIDLPFIP